MLSIEFEQRRHVEDSERNGAGEEVALEDNEGEAVELTKAFQDMTVKAVIGKD